MPLPKKNVAFDFDVSLVDSANRPQFRANPTLAAGDVKVSTNNGAFANLATLPVVSPAAGRNVRVSLSASEMNGDRVCIQFVDAAGAEWDDLIVEINTSANTVEDVIADTDDIQTRIPAALVSGRMDSSVGAYQTGLTPLQPTVAGRTLDVSAGGEAGLDWANIGSPTTVVGLSGTTVKTATDVETDTQDIQSRLPAALVGGRMDSDVGAMQANVITASSIAASAITNAKFNSDFPARAIRAGTCQAGSTSTTIVLDTGASAIDDFYKDCHVQTGTGTGAGQQRHIISYVGATRTATVSRAWATTPDNTTTFSIAGNDSEWNTDRSGHAISGSFGQGVASVQGNVTGSVGSVTAGVTVTTNNDKTGYALTAAERDAVAAALLDLANGVEVGLTFRNFCRLMGAANAGKLSGAATTTIVIRNPVADSKDRITATVDASGNRTAFSYDFS